jgi:hypothetical protein
MVSSHLRLGLLSILLHCDFLIKILYKFLSSLCMIDALNISPCLIRWFTSHLRRREGPYCAVFFSLQLFYASWSSSSLRSILLGGGAVAQLVEALCHTLEGRWFNVRWGHSILQCNFSSITMASVSTQVTTEMGAWNLADRSVCKPDSVQSMSISTSQSRGLPPPIARIALHCSTTEATSFFQCNSLQEGPRLGLLINWQLPEPCAN